MSPNETASDRGSTAPTATSTTATTYTLLHVVGSPKDTFNRNMSVMHGRAAAKAGYEVAGLNLLHRYALVHPGGTWSFPLDLSEEEVVFRKTMAVVAAMDMVERMRVDLVVMHVHTTTKNYKTLFELLDIPVIGTCGEASANVADKSTSRALLQQAGLPVAPGTVLARAEYRAGHCMGLVERQGLALPLVVKPTRMEASVGVTLVASEEELEDAVQQAFQHGDAVLIDTFIPGREVRSAALEITDNEFVPLPVIEYEMPSSHAIRTVANKVEGDGKKLVTAGYRFLGLEDDTELVTRMQELAVMAHRVLGCRDFSFIDCRLNEAGELFILESNVFAAFNPGSVMTKMTLGAGISHRQFWGAMVRKGIARGASRKEQKGSSDFMF